MSFTVTTAQNEIAYRLRDPNNVMLPSAQALELLNRGCKDFSRRTRIIRFDHAVTVTVADNNELSVSEATIIGNSGSKILSIERVLWNTGNLTTPAYHPLDPTTIEKIHTEIDSAPYVTSAYPLEYAIEIVNTDLSGSNTVIAAKKLYLYPSPGSANSPYTSLLRVIGRRTHTDTGSMGSTQPLEFPEEYHEAPILWAVWKGFERDGAFERANVIMQQYMEMVQQANSARDLIDDCPVVTESSGWSAIND